LADRKDLCVNGVAVFEENSDFKNQLILTLTCFFLIEKPSKMANGKTIVNIFN